MTMNDEIIIAPCDVCYLVDGDERQKPVLYCGQCDAYICDLCRPKRWRRAWAMFIRKIYRVRGIQV